MGQQPGECGRAAESRPLRGQIFGQVSHDENPAPAIPGSSRIHVQIARPIRYCRSGPTLPAASWHPCSSGLRSSPATSGFRCFRSPGTVLGALFFVHLANFYGWTLLWIVGGLLVALFVIRSLGATVWFLGRHPFSVCDLGLSEAAAPGGAIRCAVRIVTRRPVEIKEVRVTLTAEQRDAEGKSRKVLSLDHDLCCGEALPAGGRWEVTSELPIPEDARFSYRSYEGRFPLVGAGPASKRATPP